MALPTQLLLRPRQEDARRGVNCAQMRGEFNLKREGTMNCSLDCNAAGFSQLQTLARFRGSAHRIELEQMYVRGLPFA